MMYGGATDCVVALTIGIYAGQLNIYSFDAVG